MSMSCCCVTTFPPFFGRLFPFQIQTSFYRPLLKTFSVSLIFCFFFLEKKLRHSLFFFYVQSSTRVLKTGWRASWPDTKSLVTYNGNIFFSLHLIVQTVAEKSRSDIKHFEPVKNKVAKLIWPSFVILWQRKVPSDHCYLHNSWLWILYLCYKVPLQISVIPWKYAQRVTHISLRFCKGSCGFRKISFLRFLFSCA